MNESYISKIFKIGTAGFIKEDGTFLYADEDEEGYHGGFDEKTVNAEYPEFSNTHPEEDTCVRLFKEPNEIQYKKLEEVIDTYLDFEQYCKVEVWNKGKYNFYKVYSLVKGACEDNSWEEEIGNWTGYKLVQIIKNQFNNKVDEKIVQLANGKWQVQSEKGRNMGTYATKKEAEKRLGQVEYFKHINESYDKYLYHATFGKYWKEIKKAGYIGNSKHSNWDFSNKNVVCLAKDSDEAYSYCDSAEDVSDSVYDSGIVVLKIDASKLDKDKLDFDRNQVYDSDYITDDMVSTYEYSGIIPLDAVVEVIEESFKTINESTRSTLIAKSKSADKYANGKGSRWTAKSNCIVANTVKDYNKIDMNTFWKQDKLTFGVKVKGENDTYIVTISFKDILNKIQKKIKDNKQLLEYKCIYDALIQAINSGDIKYECTCPDFKYRLKYWVSEHDDNSGSKETRKSNITNPEDTKGPACKHILAVLNNVEWLNKIASVINNYANYCKDNMEDLYSRFIFPKLYGMPYNKAVQMTINDYDENGEIKNDLESDEELINLSNALGKERGKFKRGSNKNPASKKNDK